MTKSALALVCLLLSAGPALADQPLSPRFSFAAAAETGRLGTAADMLLLDYQKLDLTTGGKFDLFGVHYLHGLTDWLYAGIGYSTPMVEGDYGGFFAADLIVHAQTKIVGDWFVDAGLAVGAAAGGSDFRNIQDLSGTGAYVRKYAGIGYDFGPVQIGVNYSDIAVDKSRIDDGTFTFFLQKPLSYALGSYADAGKAVAPADFGALGNETVISTEVSSVKQIDPVGDYTGNIGMLSPQIAQFIDPDTYYFFGLDLGFSGLIWYNQAQAGFGRRIALTPRINLYGQLGIGSGGWTTDAFDTGPGLVVFPEAKAEYMFSDSIGLSASAGYLFAPLGTSKNWSFGVGINYHLPSADQASNPDSPDREVALKGVRINLFERVLTDIRYDGGSLDDLYLASTQFDYNVDDHWYVPIQIAAATNDFRGTAGYVEGLAGLGWQSDPVLSGRLQGYAQLMTGLNDAGLDPGPLLYPSVGFHYGLNERYSIYGQFGKTASLGRYIDPDAYSTFDGVSIGLGVSYRVSLPTWK